MLIVTHDLDVAFALADRVVMMRDGRIVEEGSPQTLATTPRAPWALIDVKPAVMLMDEPLSALDAQTRELLIDDLVSLWAREPFTALYVTHNLSEAVRLGHKIVVLSRRPGEVREVMRIDRPLDDRALGDAELDRRQKQLWDAIRGEARAADEELIHG